MAEEEAYRTRAILNANRGVSNVIDHDIIKCDLQGVADKLFNILKGHYGPFSGFAAIDTGIKTEETTFTKDGIGIVRAIEFASPQEDWVRKTIAYIGTKIESSVGDGTTSAMMFTCAMLKHMLEHIDEIRPINYNSLRIAFADLVDRLKLLVDDYKFGVYDADKKVIEERIYPIVYNQVYTSSHGDTELAKALAKLFESTPPELWDRMTYERRTYESDERFVITEPEGQYQMTSEVMMPGMLNKDLSTKFELENATLFIMNDAIRTDSFFWDDLLFAMGEVEKHNTNPTKQRQNTNGVVIICNKTMDNNSYQELLLLLNKWKKEGKVCAIFYKDAQNPKVNDYVTLQLLSDIDITTVKPGDAIERTGVTVKFQNEILTLDKLYDVPDEYKDKKERYQALTGSLQYTDYMTAVKKFADSYAKADQTPAIRRQRTEMYRMYAKLRYTKIPTLTIGGHAYDNLAMVDVIDDCMRAAAKALVNGIVFGNNRTLWHAIANLPIPRLSHTQIWIVKCLRRSLRDIARAAYERLLPECRKSKWTRFKEYLTKDKQDFISWWYSRAIDILRYNHHLHWRKQCFAPVRLESFVANKKLLDAQSAPVIVQPANTDISMLERFAEVALKYVLTERIVVLGAAYVDRRSAKK